MNDKPELDLLVEIARLLKRYGPETFERLAAQIASPQFSEQLATVFSGVAKAGRACQIGRSQAKRQGHRADNRSSRSTLRSSLTELRGTEPEKSALLIEFYDSLVARKILPTLRDIQNFAADAGLPRPKATARGKAIAPFLRGLMGLSVEELRDKLASLKPLSNQDDRSLGRWTDVILGREMRR